MNELSAIARMNIAAMDDETFGDLRAYFAAAAECAANAESKAEAVKYLAAFNEEHASRQAGARRRISLQPSTQPPLYVPGLPRGTETAMCECGDHWYVHRESERTAAGRPCYGWKGTATPGPYELCNCPGFRPWSGPWDARTGAPVKPITLVVPAAPAPREAAP